MKLGYIDGKYYTEYVDQIKQFKREKKYDIAIVLLKRIIDVVEEESKAENSGVAPWYYEQLAIIYKNKKDRQSEIDILKRFSKQKHAPGVKPLKLLERLSKIN